MEAFKTRKSYQSILLSAKTLFWKHGVKRVSIEEVCKNAGVSKMTFYRMFKNKVELVSHLLEGLTDDGLKSYQEIMDSELVFPEKVKAMVREKHKQTIELSQEFLEEVFASNEPKWQELLVSSHKEMTSLLRKDFTAAQKEGWLRQDLSMDFIFYMLEDMQSKIQDSRFLSLHKGNVQEAIMEMTKFFFYGVTPEKDHKSE